MSIFKHTHLNTFQLPSDQLVRKKTINKITLLFFPYTNPLRFVIERAGLYIMFGSHAYMLCKELKGIGHLSLFIKLTPSILSKLS